MYLAQLAYAKYQTYLAVPGVTDNAPSAPTEKLGSFGSTFIGWMKWIVLVGGVIGLIVCAAMLVVGRRNRNAVAQDGIVGGVWVIGGISMCAIAFGFTDAVFNITG